jgi:hypothetical protein
MQGTPSRYHVDCMCVAGKETAWRCHRHRTCAPGPVIPNAVSSLEAVASTRRDCHQHNNQYVCSYPKGYTTCGILGSSMELSAGMQILTKRSADESTDARKHSRLNLWVTVPHSPWHATDASWNATSGGAPLDKRCKSRYDCMHRTRAARSGYQHEATLA